MEFYSRGVDIFEVLHGSDNHDPSPQIYNPSSQTLFPLKPGYPYRIGCLLHHISPLLSSSKLNVPYVCAIVTFSFLGLTIITLHS